MENSDLKEIKDLLKQVFANQVVLYKRLDEIEQRLSSGSRGPTIKQYKKYLLKEAKDLPEATIKPDK